MEDDFIDVNLDDVDDGRSPLPAGPTAFRVASAQKKQKEGSPNPYIELTLSPTSAEFSHRKAWLNLSFHPRALWNLKLFMKDGVGIKWDPKGLSPSRLAQQFAGLTFGANVSLVPDERSQDPDTKKNDIGPPYYKA